ncbi:2-amino-4-hydroxy-6-hydroxymethyldihydropteridine diphosphokinase [Cyanobium sp. N.Huapi 1H5]|uniref:2-amino-4-hydroxy-6- hydroxymethyldihydropteridine diphosphokinase n=1 Tax=Cyanobium sp. N.Huapi 1H5 TaxID=2823719 RepID=UPI0020CC9221|nr:2-amino-4-hydroxy-6-hydroxymethyldihydropteridine diphosphokinase [Cyanobium sp. N.Huapi 1H5]MCP9837620.1 2-amino-4-hydroxy-6-hydroxymethyldihydropteridine diphosphokinase [Cyanobium sp. N.Huapi 1H5]
MPPTPAAQTAGPSPSSLAVAIGANLGDPVATFTAVRPRLEAELRAWAAAPLQLSWSPRFRTQPVGGPPGQPPYLNAVVLVRLAAAPVPAACWPDPLALLERLLRLEAAFGRERRERWGPRRLDLDLLWCGAMACSGPELVLPHPRLGERAFVLAPLAAIDPDLPVPLAPAGTPRTASAGLAALPGAALEPPPLALAGEPGWPEGP